MKIVWRIQDVVGLRDIGALVYGFIQPHYGVIGGAPAIIRLSSVEKAVTSLYTPFQSVNFGRAINNRKQV